MGWLRSVGSIKLYVSFAEYLLFYRPLLQKSPIILSILLTKATPYRPTTSPGLPNRIVVQFVCMGWLWLVGSIKTMCCSVSLDPWLCISCIQYNKSLPQCVAVSCSELQWVAVSELQCVAMCPLTLDYVHHVCTITSRCRNALQWVAVSCSELQRVAACCSVLQRVSWPLTMYIMYAL